MENFEIRFKMATPIAFGYRKPFAPLMLDGLLTWMLKGDSKEENLPDVQLPLEQSGEKHPYYHASAWELVDPEFGTYCFVKTKPDDWAKRFLKTERMLEVINYIATPEVVFQARGSRRDVHKIIARTGGVVSLGSKRIAGWGRVNSIQISNPLPDDYSVWDQYGKPARPIPVAEISREVHGGVVLMPYKPPYWAGEKVPCLVPSLERWWPGISEKSIMEIENQLAKSET